jgi:hypothetical protein
VGRGRLPAGLGEVEDRRPRGPRRARDEAWRSASGTPRKIQSRGTSRQAAWSGDSSPMNSSAVEAFTSRSMGFMECIAKPRSPASDLHPQAEPGGTLEA